MQNNNQENNDAAPYIALFQTTPFIVLSILVKRAISGKLITKKRKKFTKMQLDMTTTKGRVILDFLKNLQFYFPAPSFHEGMRRIEYILNTLEMSQIDVIVEIEDIRKCILSAEEKNSLDVFINKELDIPKYINKELDISKTINKEIDFLTRMLSSIHEDTSRISKDDIIPIDEKNRLIKRLQEENTLLQAEIARLKTQIACLLKENSAQLLRHSTFISEIEKLARFGGKDLIAKINAIGQAIEKSLAITMQEFSARLKSTSVQLPQIQLPPSQKNDPNKTNKN